MAGIGADIWVCGNCRSVNNLRSKQCYHCRTPKDLAAVDPAAIEGTGHGQLREIAIPEFHASRGEAMLASALILFVAVMQVVSTVFATIALNGILDDPGGLVEPDADRVADLLTAGVVGLATTGVGILALTGWAFWLSRVVTAMPALGLGYPAANGLMAFVENFIPGLNLLRVPAIVRDVIRRLEPGQDRGELLIFAAWIGLFGGFLIPRVGRFLNAFGADTLEGAVRNAIGVQALATVLVVLGAIFLVVLIWWIEARIARRRVAQLAGEGPPEPPPAVPIALAGSLAAPVLATAAPELAGRPEVQRAPFAPAMVIDEAPAAPSRPFVATPPPAGSQADVGPAPVAGPLGTVPVDRPVDTYLNRPITAATGAASIPDLDAMADVPPEHPDVERFADARPTWADPVTAPVASVEPVEPIAPVAPEPVPVEPAEPAAPVEPEAAALADTTAAPPAAPAVGHVPTGPRLQLRVESGTSIIGTLDGESEPISIDELQAAAGALARADGSATISMGSSTFEAKALAQQALEILSDAGAIATLED